MPAIQVTTSITDINPDAWNKLTGTQPFLRHEFFLSLETSGCLNEGSGWSTYFLTLYEKDVLSAALPLYIKYHSYGEYVFDWAWADSYARRGLAYYPKLLSAVPFTPVTGKRLLGSDPEHRAALMRHALNLARELGLSSFHCLFPAKNEAEEMQIQGMQIRSGVQFHWYNRGYASFTDFLEGLLREKRKKIRQERRQITDAGLTFQRLTGNEIKPADWQLFFNCYLKTYRSHHSSPYLNLKFFEQLGAVMGENILLVIALQQGVPIAAALNLFDEKRLYGRYWGALTPVPQLHFETCYYQAIEFCIERGLDVFEAGAQGEHKLARGFVPMETWSAHWLARADFSNAVKEFLSREAQLNRHYVAQLGAHSPYKIKAN